MKEMISVHGVFTEPFKVTKVEVKKNNGLAIITQRNELTELKVLSTYFDKRFSLYAGDSIFVKSSDYTLPYARSEIMTHNGVDFIKVPIEQVVAIKKGDAL